MKLLFHTRNYGYLADAIINDVKLDVWNGNMKVETFPDGEIYHRIESDVNDHDVYLIGGTISDAETMELFDVASALVQEGARSLTVIIPYFGYSTAERAVKPGEIVKAKTRAELLSHIDQGSVRNRFFFIDLHAEGIPHYFEGGVQTKHLYTKNIIKYICLEIKEKNKLDNFVLGSTDAGRAKWIESLSKDMGVECAIIIKRRTGGAETEIRGVNADVKGKAVIIYDDMIRTGGSLVKAAKTYRDAGATHVFAIATHGVLPTGSIENIRASRCIEKVYVMDTHPNAINLKNINHPQFSAAINSFMEIKSVAQLIIDNVFKKS